MKTKRMSWLGLLALGLLGVPGLLRAAVLQTIGTQHFTDGQTVTTGVFNTTVTGQPAPFNAFIGSDPTGPNFSASWGFSYAPVSVAGALLTIGILDHDSAAAGNQVASFTEGANDLTALLNAAFESRGGANSQYNVYTISLPSSVLADVAGGAPQFSLTLQGPGLGVLGTTPFNGAGLDFVTLASVPEPGTWMMLLVGIGGITARRLQLPRR